MKVWGRHVFICALQLFLFVSASASAEPIWGINGHPFTAYAGISGRDQISLLKDLGIKSYRVNIGDIRFAPALKELVVEAKAAGIDILPLLTPDVNLETESTQDLYAKSHKLAFTLASGLSDQVRTWELGNELENYAIIKACEMQDDGVQYNCSWGPAGGTGPLHYYTPRWIKVSAVLKGLIDGINAVDPTLKKAIGTAGWGHSGAFTRMLQDGIDWDISVWHHYEGDPEDALKLLAPLGRPIWITEFNNSRGSEAGEKQQAQGLVAMMQHLRNYSATYRVEAAHIYELLDEPYWAPSFEAVMGLVRLNKEGNGWRLGQPKEAYEAVKKFIANAPADTPKGGSVAAPPKLQLALSEASPRGAMPCNPGSFNRTVTTFENQVVYSYCLITGRLPSPAEQWQYVLTLKSGHDTLYMLREMLTVERNEANAALQTLPNGEFVMRLYQLLLGRNPDGRGFADYVSQLDSNSLSRGDLQLAFLNSSEFRSRHALLFPQR